MRNHAETTVPHVNIARTLIVLANKNCPTNPGEVGDAEKFVADMLRGPIVPRQVVGRVFRVSNMGAAGAARPGRACGRPLARTPGVT